jgi:hypothetical protein
VKNINDLSDILAVMVGVLGAFVKGVKRRIGVLNTILGMVVGAILAFGTIGVIDQFFSHLNERIVIVISFSVGWVANEITEYLDDAIKILADKIIQKASDKVEKYVGKNDKNEE